MSREWKPGDVAAFTFDGERVNGIRTTEGKWTAYAPGLASGEVRSWIDRPWDGLHGQRPLVVIDPEDREQVERLVNLVDDSFNDVRVDGTGPTAVDLAQIRLRKFADPTPRIEEPTGLGAVVEDDEGRAWVRTHATGYPWHTYFDPSDRNSTAVRKFADLTPVRVLSPGVEVSQ